MDSSNAEPINQPHLPTANERPMNDKELAYIVKRFDLGEFIKDATPIETTVFHLASEALRLRVENERLRDVLGDIVDLHEVGVWQDIAERALNPEPAP